MFDAKRFDDAVQKSGLKKQYIAKKIGISYDSLRKKMSGELKWKVDEALAVSTILRMSKAERDAIFFASDVCK